MILVSGVPRSDYRLADSLKPASRKAKVGMPTFEFRRAGFHLSAGCARPLGTLVRRIIGNSAINPSVMTFFSQIA